MLLNASTSVLYGLSARVAYSSAEVKTPLEHTPKKKVLKYREFGY